MISQAELERMSRRTQVALVRQRSTELAFQIEGLRRGRLKPPRGMDRRQLIRNARRRLSHLHHVAMELGLWEEIGCSPGEE